MKTVEFVIDGEPIGKGRPRFTRTGHAYTPKKYIDIWFGRKNIVLINYKAPWKENGNPPMFGIMTNGAKRKNGDTCLDVSIHFGYLVLMYTDFNLQRK